VWMQCSAIGASFCYLLSYLVGRRLVWRYIPERAIEWSTHVNVYLSFVHVLARDVKQKFVNFSAEL